MPPKRKSKADLKAASEDGTLSEITTNETTPAEEVKATKKPRTYAAKAKKETFSIPEDATDSLPHPINTKMPESFSFEAVEESHIKISTWNVASITAAQKKGFKTYVESENADILCICETKTAGKVDGVVEDLYPHQYWSVQDPKTKNSFWAGVAIFSKVEPISVKFGIGKPEFDNEGRVIIAEFKGFYIVHTYMPNSSKELVRLTFKQQFNSEIEAILKDLDSKKPTIWTGDLNVAHTALDLTNPTTNTKTPGFTPEERNDFSRILAGPPTFVDTWRHFYPKEVKGYTFYGYRFKCREKGIGWRLDYFVVSERMMVSDEGDSAS
ncbi:DNA-(apurinic or apyrimidinic site) lyase [Phlyctochytrium planicorne]|nr:DNA-(apurinic or apyrimidinic site) lyase [Phlyctochytrium planicorne]